MSTASFLFSSRQVAVFRVFGPDAESYLQGRLTQNIRQLELGQGSLSLLLSPQGKVQGQFVVLKQDKDFLLVLDPEIPGEVVKTIKEHLLCFKVADQLEVEEQRLSCLSLRAVDQVPLKEFNQLQDFYQHAHLDFKGISFLALKIPRPLRAFELLLGEKEAQELETLILDLNKDLSLASKDLLELERLQAGFPRFGVDLSEKVFAGDLPSQDYISFDKGCYAGQEAVEMAIARGRPNRELLLFSHSGRSEAELGEPITTSQEADKSCGQITSICYDVKSNRSFGLGFLKTKRLEGELFWGKHQLKKEEAIRVV